MGGKGLPWKGGNWLKPGGVYCAKNWLWEFGELFIIKGLNCGLKAWLKVWLGWLKGWFGWKGWLKGWLLNGWLNGWLNNGWLKLLFMFWLEGDLIEGLIILLGWILDGLSKRLLLFWFSIIGLIWLIFKS